METDAPERLADSIERLTRAMDTLMAGLREMQNHRAWWARNNPVAYVWLCRAERAGHEVPWSQ